ncbi:MAG: hypothetical protein PVF93_04150 [Chromatiaceae bacterium]|jgi:hypothetical protein
MCSTDLGDFHDDVDLIAGKHRLARTPGQKGENQTAIAGKLGAEDARDGYLNQTTRYDDILRAFESHAGGLGSQWIEFLSSHSE